MRIRTLIAAVLTVVFFSLSPLASFAHEFGLADISGKILLPPVYQEVRYVSANCFRVTPKGDPRTVIPFFVNE